MVLKITIAVIKFNTEFNKYIFNQTLLTGIMYMNNIFKNPYCEGTSHKRKPPLLINSIVLTYTCQWCRAPPLILVKKLYVLKDSIKKMNNGIISQNLLIVVFLNLFLKKIKKIIIVKIKKIKK